MSASRSRQDIFIPYPAHNISRIPHPSSILCPIPHPAKPMLDPPFTGFVEVTFFLFFSYSRISNRAWYFPQSGRLERLYRPALRTDRRDSHPVRYHGRLWHCQQGATQRYSKRTKHHATDTSWGETCFWVCGFTVKVATSRVFHGFLV